MSEKNDQDHQSNEETLVVGLGASAGGLEALKEFFSSLPDQTGMAFIVVLHLAPEKKSNLTETLQHETELEVEQVSGNPLIKADHVYIIPPDKMLTVEDDHLVLSQPNTKHGLNTINLLLRTLAEKKGKYAAGIILSGSGSDGTNGLKAIKEHEGFALVQAPEEAKSTGMPHNAIKTGVMDKVMSVKEMAAELVRYRETFSKINMPEKIEETGDSDIEEVLSEIFKKLRDRVGHDFGNYRRSSVLRRIGRRMRVVQIHSLPQYRDYLDDHPDEIDELFKDLLISVTNFFRDPESFKALEEQVIPKLFEEKGQNDQLRVWVPGCATGEEAYSVAMLLLEYSEKANNYPEIQVFASDVDEEALRTAREGRYPKSIEEDVSEDRLRRFFKESGDEYKVKKELQDIILFASHDLLGNAPFSNQDLIACRNLLIYLNRKLQGKVFNLFYYSLRPAGWLFLGRSDSHIGTEGLFKTVDQSHHIYRQKPSSHTHTALPDLPLLYESRRAPSTKETPTQRKHNIEHMHWHILARLFAPQSVLIDDDYNVVHATEGINKYLEYGGGEPSRNILDMAKPKIRQSLRGVLFKISKAEAVPAQQKIHVNLDGEKKNLEIIVRKHRESEDEEGLIHVVFKEIEGEGSASGKLEAVGDGELSDRGSEIIKSLEKELEYTKEQLQISIEQYETSNEELRTSNEELQSMNEEMQSTTEELETSKEELQSVNEELKTVNEELENKVHELSRANNDLQNLMEATEVGILFVDVDLRVQRFTDASTEIFNLISSDEGRPLDHITHTLDYDDLLADIRQVLEDQEHQKKVVAAGEDQHYIMRLRPYRSTEDKMEGVVLTFTEITELKASQERLERKRKQESSLATLGLYALEEGELEAIMHRAIQQTCIILDLDCVVIFKLNKEKDLLEVAYENGCVGEPEAIKNHEQWDVGYSLRSKEVTKVLDYKDEKRFEISPVLAESDFVSSLHIAIEGREEVYGVFGIYVNAKRAFTEYDENFVQIVASIIGSAMERSKARAALQKTNDQLKQEIKKSEQYQKDILSTSIADRWELGGYLHDNLAQSLVSAKILVTTVGKEITAGKDDMEVSHEIERINNIIDQCIADIRNLTHDIIPVDIEKESVEHAFHFLMQQTQKLHGVNCSMDTGEILNKIKNRTLATHLYYIMHEAVKNAAMHGEAENIVVSIYQSDDQLVLATRDDGIGISNNHETSNGNGLRIMKHRMEMLGGTLETEEWSEEEQSGTRVVCRLPIAKIEEVDK